MPRPLSFVPRVITPYLVGAMTAPTLRWLTEPRNMDTGYGCMHACDCVVINREQSPE